MINVQFRYWSSISISTFHNNTLLILFCLMSPTYIYIYYDNKKHMWHALTVGIDQSKLRNPILKDLVVVGFAYKYGWLMILLPRGSIFIHSKKCLFRQLTYLFASFKKKKKLTFLHILDEIKNVYLCSLKIIYILLKLKYPKCLETCITILKIDCLDIRIAVQN